MKTKFLLEISVSTWAGHKIKRCKTALLPLETVQPAEEVHHHVLTMSIRDGNALARQRAKGEVG